MLFCETKKEGFIHKKKEVVREKDRFFFLFNVSGLVDTSVRVKNSLIQICINTTCFWLKMSSFFVTHILVKNV